MERLTISSGIQNQVSKLTGLSFSIKVSIDNFPVEKKTIQNETIEFDSSIGNLMGSQNAKKCTD